MSSEHDTGAVLDDNVGIAETCGEGERENSVSSRTEFKGVLTLLSLNIILGYDYWP